MAEFKGTPGPWVKDFGGTLGHIKSVPVGHDPKLGGRTPTVAIYDIDLVNRDKM